MLLLDYLRHVTLMRRHAAAMSAEPLRACRHVTL